jgi:hypothetical protein
MARIDFTSIVAISQDVIAEFSGPLIVEIVEFLMISGILSSTVPLLYLAKMKILIWVC